MNRNWLRYVVGISCLALVASATLLNANTYGPFTTVMISFSSPTSVDAGDMDADGKTDLVVSTSSTLGWYKSNNVNGSSWASHVTIDNTKWGCVSVFVKDYDLDGDLDIIGGRTDTSAGYPYPCYACWWENSGSATFTQHDIAQIGTNGPVHWVEAADIDADGSIDVAYAQYNEIGWVSHSGTKTALESSSYQYRCAHPANLDSDSALEITGTIYYGSSPGFDHTVSVWGLGGSRVDLATSTTTPLSGAWAAWDFDYDGDGDQDVAVCSLGSDKTKVWTNQGSGSFAYHSQLDGATTLRSGYFDSSSPYRQSLVAGGAYRIHNWTGSSWDTTNVAINLSNGSQSGLTVRDIDQDGDLDFCGPAGFMFQWWRQ